MKYIKKILRNKYLLILIGFGVWMLFFDENDIPQQIKRHRTLNKLEKNEQVLKDKIAKTKQELNDLENDPATLEKYAREKYLMKKPNEDLFIIESSNDK